MSKTYWDLLHFYSFYWASCTNTFKDIPLNVIQLNWDLMCRLKGFGPQIEELSLGLKR